MILFLLLLIPSVYAEVNNYNNVSTLVTDVTVSSSLERTSGSLIQLFLELDFYPKEYFAQKILTQDFISQPEAKIENTDVGVEFSWLEDSSIYTYSIQSKVQTENTLIKVQSKIIYPIEVPEEILVYTIPTDILDITPEISILGEEIVGGEDDVYKMVFLLANWTKENIAYNLSTINVQANEKSSYVLEHREGVCDELTNLFISLARSRGIPARFVSGIVYSNLKYTFGPHGWAEVYIDNKWIPVDVTFGTFGWIDPSHIKFKEELSSNSASTSYSWSGKNINIDVEEVNITAKITETSGKAMEYVNIEIFPLQNAVGPGSFVAVQVLVSNKNSFYVPLELSLTKAPGIVGTNTKSVLLSPHEEKSIFWVLTIPENIEPGYVYTTFLEIQTMYGGIAQTNFTYSELFTIFSQNDAEKDIALLIIDESKAYLDDVSLDCSLDKEYYYSNNEAIISCSLDGAFDGAKACFQNVCKDATENIQWNVPLKDFQSQRLFVSVAKNGKERYSYFTIQIIKEANLRIENIQPDIIDFSQEIPFSFSLVTDSPIENITLNIDSLGGFTLDYLNKEKEIIFNVEGRNLYRQKLRINFNYFDILGKEYQTEQEIVLIVENIPWYYSLFDYFLLLWD